MACCQANLPFVLHLAPSVALPEVFVASSSLGQNFESLDFTASILEALSLMVNKAIQNNVTVSTFSGGLSTS